MILILAGPSGQGKTTWAMKHPKFHPKRYFSADAYFTQADGSYNFNPKELPLAHGACLKNFAMELKYHDAVHDVIIVDNTNTTAVEMAPYIRLAQAYGALCEIHMFITRPLESKNLHGVPPSTVIQQYNRCRMMLESNSYISSLAILDEYRGRRLNNNIFQVPLEIH